MMKELLTLKEAASLTGKTTKTIKNYIKSGKIRNFFMVEGKYGQEYRINLKDVEPLMKKGRKISPGKMAGSSPGKNPYAIDDKKNSGETFTAETIYDRPEYRFILRRNDEILVELGRCREELEELKNANLALRQEIEEKNMLIALLSKKESSE
jgi:excisionase family DNA binding protein